MGIKQLRKEWEEARKPRVPLRPSVLGDQHWHSHG